MNLIIEKSTYGRLLAESQPKPIQNENDYDNALEVVNVLMQKENLTPEETTLLEVWVILVEEYEDKNYSLPEASPLEVLNHLMEVRGLKQVNLVGVLGSKGNVSDVIHGKRAISKTQAKALGEFFHVDYSLFV